MRTACALTAALVAPLIALAGCGERRVVLHQVPEPAQSAIVEHAEGRLITGIAQDRLCGRERFTVIVEADGQVEQYAVDDAGNPCPDAAVDVVKLVRPPGGNAPHVQR